MEDLQKLIENSTHQITDENLNKWKVIEVSDLEEIMQAYHQAQLKLLGLQNFSVPKGTVCPKCKSKYVYYWLNHQVYECDDCNERWQTER